MTDTITTLRPNSSSVGTGYGTVTGAANLHTALSDNSDSSYGTGVYTSGDVLRCYYSHAPASRFGFAATTNGSAIITSTGYPSLRFLPTDVGSAVTGTGIPGATTIISVQSSSQATMSANATATGTATLTVSTTYWALPAYAIVKSVTFRTRWNGSGGVLTATIRGNVFPATGPSTTYTVGAGIVSFYGPVLTTRWDGVPWSAADVALLQQEVLPESGVTVNWYEAWADIAYNLAPTATPTLPAAGNITTPIPAITWTYDDAESDPQDRYWVKVFDSATYGAAGFDPETSAAAWDSDEQLGTATSILVDSQLANTTTFKAYVKVSDAGSNGRYGAWGVGPAFTTAVQFPAVPTIVSATPDPTNNRVAIVVQGSDNELTRNMATAETSAVGLEADTNIAVSFTVADGVTTSGSATVTSATAAFQAGDVGKTISGTGIPGATTILQVASATSITMSANATATASGVTLTIGRGFPWRSTAQSSEGAASFIMRSAASGDMAIRTAAASTGVMVPVKASLQYTALASFRAKTTTRNARVEVFWYQAGGAASAVRASDAGSNVSATSAAFIQGSVTAVSPSDAAFAVVKCRVLSTAAAGEDFYVDQLDLGPGASTVWTRGGFVQQLTSGVDNFNRADSAASMGTASGSGGAWAPPVLGAATSVWGISSNQAYYVSTTGGVSSVLTLGDMADGTLTCDILMGALTTSGACVVFRGNQMLWWLGVELYKDSTTSNVQLIKVVNTKTTLATAANAGITNNRLYGVKIDFAGARVVVSLDRKDGAGYAQVIDYTLSAADMAFFGGAGNNQYGIAVLDAADTAIRWDNFSVVGGGSQQVVVERSTDGGTTWSTVRSINRLGLTDPGQQGTFYDYEAPRALQIKYRARIYAAEIDVVTLGSPSSVVTMTPNLLGDSLSWLKSPSDPTKNMVVPLLKDSVDSVSQEDMSVFEPLGRFDPLIHRGTIRSEQFGALEFMFSNDAGWQAFETLRARQEPLLLQTCYGDTLGYEQFWVVLGPTREIHRLTSDDMSVATKRRVKIPARQVTSPLVT